MKASIKFREDQKPLLRAKLPLNILGLSFQSGITAGDTNDLTLHLSSFFQSGPSIKFAYRPNDSTNPFSLFLKTGTGSFGSPISSSMLMTAEFSFVSKGNSNINPRFMLHFKPQFGDFCVKKCQSSTPVFDKLKTTSFESNDVVSSDEDGSIEMVETPISNGFCGKRITVSTQQKTAARAIAAAFSGVEVVAKTKIPVKSCALMSFSWGVRVPAEKINLKKIPFLVMNKIAIEHVYGVDESKSKVVKENKNDDVVEACVKVKRQVEWLQTENLELKKAVDELKQEIGFAGKVKLSNGRSYLNGGKMEEKKSMETDLSEEIKKSLKGASVSGGEAGRSTTVV